MKTVAVLGGKGGTTKTATSHLLALGAHLNNEPACYALTDPLRKVRAEGRPYAVLDARSPQQLALMLDQSRNNLNGWLVIDGGGNRPDFDLAIAKEVDLTLIPFRNSEEDIDTVAQSLRDIPNSFAWPSAWPTNPLAIASSKYFIDGLKKAYPSRVITPPIPFVNSVTDLLSTTLNSPSTPVRSLARKVFRIVAECYAENCEELPAKNRKSKRA